MSFGGLLFTNLGKNLQAKAIAGIQLNFTKIVIGDGELGSASILDLKNVVHEIKSLTITKLKSTPDGKAILGTTFDNNNLATGFYWREIGVYANDPTAGEILYCYGNAGVNAEYIPASGGAQIIEKALDLTVIVGNATNVTATIASNIYAKEADLILLSQEVKQKANKTEIPAPYVHPNDANTRHVTDSDKANWNGKANGSHTHSKSQITDFPTLSNVAISGNYNDLSNKPSIPSAVAVIDNLSSTSTISALSANQGKNLNDQINNQITRDAYGKVVSSDSPTQTFPNLSYQATEGGHGINYNITVTFGSIVIKPQLSPYCFISYTFNALANFSSLYLEDAQGNKYFDLKTGNFVGNLKSTKNLSSLTLYLRGYLTINATVNYILSDIKLYLPKRGEW